jgi:thymidylate kinase
MESQGADFFARVEEGFAALAKADPRRWKVVEATGPVGEVAGRVLEAVVSGIGDATAGKVP